MAHKFAKYWICQVRLMEQEGDLDVLSTFEEAVRVVREVCVFFYSHVLFHNHAFFPHTHLSFTDYCAILSIFLF